MDRFIAIELAKTNANDANLKSNMDRFIVFTRASTNCGIKTFKIQYG